MNIFLKKNRTMHFFFVHPNEGPGGDGIASPVAYSSSQNATGARMRAHARGSRSYRDASLRDFRSPAFAESIMSLFHKLKVKTFRKLSLKDQRKTVFSAYESCGERWRGLSSLPFFCQFKSHHRDMRGESAHTREYARAHARGG